MTESEYVFGFFPYLKTSGSVCYRGLTIRSSDDLTGLPPDVLPHLETIRSMFFLRDHLRIQKMSYAFHHLGSEPTSFSRFAQQLLEFQAVICYLYSSPHPTLGDPFLRYQHASLYLIRPLSVSKYTVLSEHNVEELQDGKCLEFDERGFAEGYEVRLDNRSFFGVVDGNRIYPPTPDLWLNVSQDLSTDLDHRRGGPLRHKPVYEYFAGRREDDALGERVLTAIAWYNKSVSIGIAEDVALVNLAIAFESLLGLAQGPKVTERFKEAVSLLVGGFPRLDSWLTQFYEARSRIVHEGRSARLRFVATDNPKGSMETPELEYRSLVLYGLQVFRVCVVTILTGASLAEQLRLDSMLVTNQQRLERICRALSTGEGTPAERIANTSKDVDDISTYRFVAEKGLKPEQLLGTAKLMLQQYISAVPDEPSGLLTLAGVRRR